MDNTTSQAPLLFNSTDLDVNSTVFKQMDPKNPGIASRYPPGYFVISAEDMNKIRIAMYLAIIPVTALIGLVGNIFSFVVLKRHRMPKTTKMILLAITVSDFLNLITAVVYCYMTGMSRALSYTPGVNAGNMSYPIFGGYLMHVFGRISTMFIVIISVERLLAVYFPMKIRSICSPRVMGGCIFAITLLCLVFFIPMSLEYTPTNVHRPNSSEVSTRLSLTEVGKNRGIYSTYHSSSMIVTRFIPVVIVLVSNTAICVSLYRSTSRRSEMTGQKTESSDERRITKMLVSLSALYFFCVMPNSVLVIIQLFLVDRQSHLNPNNIYTLATILFYWTEVINSSANFIIYIFSSEKMRTEFKRVSSCGWNGSSRSRKSPPEAYDLSSATRTTSATTVSGMGSDVNELEVKHNPNGQRL